MQIPIMAAVLCAAMLAGACQTTTRPSLGTAMPLAGAALPPIGFVEFCKRHPEDCTRSSESAGPVLLDARRWSELQRINAEVNHAIRYAGDGAERGSRPERWDYPTEAGDCEDFALEKRRRLIEAGWPEESLLMALAMVPRLGPHAVLVAVTSAGDYVLDVRHADVRRWENLDYRWLKRQSAQNPKVWVTIRSL